MITTYGVEPYYSTLERMDELFHTTDDPVLSDEFDLLSLLIGKYEEDQFPIKEADPIQVIKMNMELYEKIRCGHPR